MKNIFRINIPSGGRSLYSKLLLSFTVLTFFIVLSTSMILSSMYINSLNEQLAVESAYNLDRIDAEFNNLFSETRDFNRLLREDRSIRTFLYSSEFDALVLNHSDLFLKQVKYTSPFLHSIFLYNKSREFPIQSGNTGIDITQFLDGDLPHPDAANGFNMVLSTITSISITGSNQISNTISIVFDESVSDDLTNNSMIIMNLDREEIEKKLLGKLDGNTIVVDNSGKVIFNPYNFVNTDSIINEPLFRSIFVNYEIKGHYRNRAEAGDILITYVKNLESDLYIINLRSLSAISTPINKAITIILAISMSIVIVFSLTGLFVSNKLFLPIKKVTEKFINSKFGHQIPKMSEIDTISRIFEETTDHLKQLEDKSQSSISRHKENILRQLLKSYINSETAMRELSDCSMNVDFSDIFLVCLKIDNYMQTNNNDRLILETTICRIIPELLKDDFNCEVVNMFEGEIAILLSFKNKEKNSFPLIVSSMDRIKEMSAKTLRITLTAGIGGASKTVGECPEAYAKAVEMVKYRFVLGFGKTIYKQIIDTSLNSNLFYPYELEDKLVSSIRLNRKDLYINTLNDFFEILANCRYSEAVSVLFQVVTSCIKTVNQITTQDSRKLYLNFDEFSSIFSQFQTLEQAKKWLIDIFNEYRQIMEHINRLKVNKHYKAVEKMQDYIKQNYSDMNISVEFISELAGYTSSYFTRIFKEMTGFFINDYIRQVRIDKAKELLCNRENKISDIPAAIGLTNMSHFCTVFKKDVGLTPSAYRDYILQKSS